MLNFKEIKILHLDDNLLFAQGIQSLLGNETLIGQLVHAESLKEGMKLRQKIQPDLILLDYFLPDSEGFKSLHFLSLVSPKSKVIILTMESNPTVIEKCKLEGLLAFYRNQSAKKPSSKR